MKHRGRPKNATNEVATLKEIVKAVSEHQTDEEFLLGCLKSLPNEPATLLPSEWAEQNRFMTKTATPFPGKFKWKRSPFWREPLDCLSPFDPTQKIAVMKGTQVGFTCAVLENGIGYGMACDPMPILFVSGDEKLISRAKKTRIEPMIDSSGLRDKIRPDSLKKGVRRTGDSGGMMEFAGGFITMCGPNNESNFQGLSFRALLLDEIDLYPYQLGKSGETVKVIEGRADAFKNRKKILYGSRPTVSFGISETEQDEEDEEGLIKKDTEVGSRILDLYNAGDKRKYMIPCPLCGKKQELDFFGGKTHEDIEYGIKFDSAACRDGDFSSVKYQCRHCGEQFEEFHKSEIIQPEAGAEWVPTAKAKEPYYRSYHMSALYSLTVEWWEIVKEFLQSKGDPSKLQLFYNRYLGLPFEDRSGGVRLEQLSDRQGRYVRNTLPKCNKGEGPLFLTAACDVQTGSKNPRLEVEIKAWGRDFKNWSIDYRIIKGRVDDINDPCWRQLADILDESWGTMQVERMFIDASDGNMSATIYDVCRRYGQGEKVLMIPIKGLATTARNRLYQAHKDLPNERFPLVEIFSDNYKNRVAMWLRSEWRPGESAPVGWAQFPAGYEREYYRQLTTEERIRKRIGQQIVIQWVAHGRNESWDIFCYNTACCDFVIEDYSVHFLGLEKGNPKAVWDYFESLRG